MGRIRPTIFFKQLYCNLTYTIQFIFFKCMYSLVFVLFRLLPSPPLLIFIILQPPPKTLHLLALSFCVSWTSQPSETTISLPGFAYSGYFVWTETHDTCLASLTSHHVFKVHGSVLHSFFFFFHFCYKSLWLSCLLLSCFTPFILAEHFLCSSWRLMSFYTDKFLFLFLPFFAFLFSILFIWEKAQVG